MFVIKFANVLELEHPADCMILCKLNPSALTKEVEAARVLWQENSSVSISECVRVAFTQRATVSFGHYPMWFIKT